MHSIAAMRVRDLPTSVGLSRRCSSLLLADLLHALVIDQVEVHVLKSYRGESCALDDARHGLSGVRQQRVRTDRSEHGLDIVLRHVANLKNARLRSLDQKNSAILDFRSDRNGQD